MCFSLEFLFLNYLNIKINRFYFELFIFKYIKKVCVYRSLEFGYKYIYIYIVSFPLSVFVIKRFDDNFKHCVQTVKTIFLQRLLAIMNRWKYLMGAAFIRSIAFLEKWIRGNTILWKENELKKAKFLLKTDEQWQGRMFSGRC